MDDELYAAIDMDAAARARLLSGDEDADEGEEDEEGGGAADERGGDGVRARRSGTEEVMIRDLADGSGVHDTSSIEIHVVDGGRLSRRSSLTANYARGTRA